MHNSKMFQLSYLVTFSQQTTGITLNISDAPNTDFA